MFVLIHRALPLLISWRLVTSPPSVVENVCPANRIQSVSVARSLRMKPRPSSREEEHVLSRLRLSCNLNAALSSCDVLSCSSVRCSIVELRRHCIKDCAGAYVSSAFIIQQPNEQAHNGWVTLSVYCPIEPALERASEICLDTFTMLCHAHRRAHQ